MNSTTLETIGDTQIQIRRAFDAPIALVFAAHTEPAHLTQWMTGPNDLALTEATMDVRAGGAFTWGYASPSGEQMSMHGTFLEVEPPHRLVQLDDWGPNLPSPRIETTFEEVGGQTVVTMTYTLPSKEVRDHVVADGGMVEAYRLSHDRLDVHMAAAV